MSRPFLLLSTIALSCGTAAFAQQKGLSIDTEPSGAQIYINGEPVGTTPYTYTFTKAPAGSVNVELRMNGCSSRTFDIGPLLGTPQNLKHPLVAEMYRSHDPDVQKVDLPITSLLNAATSSGHAQGHVGNHKLTSTAREWRDLTYPEDLNGVLHSGLRGTFLNTITVRRGTQRGDATIRQSKVYVQPVLNAVDMDLSGSDLHAFGTVRVNMDWRFMSGIDTDSTLFTLSESNVYHVFDEQSAGCLSNAIRNAARRMADSEGLRDQLLKVYSDGLVRSKGGTVSLTQPTPIAFTGRKDMLAALVKGVVTVKTSDGHGSGFVITNDGYIVTNAHVVGDASMVTVKFNQGFSLDGQVVKVNRDFDLALIKTPGNDMAALTLGDDKQLLIGEELFAIGTPLDDDLGQTVTRGILSGRREFEGRSFLQTDVPINPGNSGGPIVDETGKVVGVATLKVSETGVQGIGFAVPTSTVLEMLNLSFQGR